MTHRFFRVQMTRERPQVSQIVARGTWRILLAKSGHKIGISLAYIYGIGEPKSPSNEGN